MTYKRKRNAITTLAPPHINHTVTHLTLISRPGHNIGAPQYFSVHVSRKLVTNQSLLSLLAF